MKSRVIVTGGRGFIGSKLAESMWNRYEEVIVIDNLSTSCTRPNVPHEVIVHDVRRPFPVTAPVIYHLACPASPDEFYRDPWGVFQTCVLGTMNALEALEPGGRLILASSSEIYGHQDEGYEAEEIDLGRVDPVGPRSCYQEGKRAAEAAVSSFLRRNKDRSGTIVRLFNIYGPAMPQDGRVMRSFIDAAADNEPLLVFDNGSQTRTFLYIDDCIEALARMNSMVSASILEVFNVGGTETISIAGLAEMVVSEMKTESQISFNHGDRFGEPKHRRPNIDRIKNRCGWEPKTSLIDGLRKTIPSERLKQAPK